MIHTSGVLSWEALQAIPEGWIVFLICLVRWIVFLVCLVSRSFVFLVCLVLLGLFSYENGAKQTQTTESN